MKRELLIAVALIFSVSAFAQTGTAKIKEGTNVKISEKSNSELAVNGQGTGAATASNKQESQANLGTTIKEPQKANGNVESNLNTNSQAAYDHNAAKLQSAISSKKALLVEGSKTIGNDLISGATKTKAGMEKIHAAGKINAASNLTIHKPTLSAKTGTSSVLGLGLK
jgi:hypothetical protein